MTPPGSIVRHLTMTVLLALSTSAALAMPSAEPSPRPPVGEGSQQGEPLACLLLDAQTPGQLKLSADQLVEWQRLQQEHALLFGDRCQNAANPPAPLPTSQPAPGPRAAQVYRKDFIDFLGGLTPEQRLLLEEIARARRDARAALEEKVLRHRLML